MRPRMKLAALMGMVATGGTLGLAASGTGTGSSTETAESAAPAAPAVTAPLGTPASSGQF